MRLNTKQISEYTGGSIIVDPIDASKLACGITWDSRSVSEDDLFVALSGETHDGHAFIDEVLTKGASIVLVSDKLPEKTLFFAQEMGAAIIEVSNTYSAVTDLAREWRHHLRGRVIGITGSSGKTTTKELVKQVLTASFSVVATEGNQNNELGVPRTLLMADPETDYVVVEMGMRGLGQIEELCEFVKPHIGLITNIGESHIELLESRENIAKAKAELLAALPPHEGIAFLNGADPYLCDLKEFGRVEERSVTTIIYDGTGDQKESATVYAENISLDSEGRPQFDLIWLDKETKRTIPAVSLIVRGLHNVSNAAAAASVGFAVGMDGQTIADALAKAEPVAGRQRILTTYDQVTVIDDAYNANPDSMRASLSMLSAFKVPGKRVVVLGDMGELGDYAQACHESIGSFAATLDIDRLICIGELSVYIAAAAAKSGLSSDKITQVDSLSEILKELDSYLEPGDVVLVKASHFMGLDRVVGGLVN